jgi:hypothetical protein
VVWFKWSSSSIKWIKPRGQSEGILSQQQWISKHPHPPHPHSSHSAAQYILFSRWPLHLGWMKGQQQCFNMDLLLGVLNSHSRHCQILGQVEEVDIFEDALDEITWNSIENYRLSSNNFEINDSMTLDILFLDFRLIQSTL